MKKIILKEQIIFKLGIIGFGGPAVHIAMMQNEVVVRKNG
jgi:chromate transporter